MRVLVLLVACGDSGAHVVDAQVDAPRVPPMRGENCVPSSTRVSCVGGMARVQVNHVPQSPMFSCSKPPDVTTATCASGCTIEGVRTYSWQATLVPKAPQLCAETDVAVAGGPCPCLPVRATLASDGTVAMTTYLRCVAGACEAAPAPTIASYLQRCDAATLAQYGVQDVNGVVVAGDAGCLLAWNPATSAVTSGVTQRCIGDWDCPAGSLCDDEVATVNPVGEAVAVCKPGPRGSLTPQMLSP